MGCFSWITSDTHRAISIYVPRTVYLLQPSGEHLREDSYEGYGVFGGQDVYDLVADWNREYLSLHPEFVLPHRGRRVDDFPWYPLYADLTKTRKEITQAMLQLRDGRYGRFWEYRSLGIELACSDEDNAALPFPIKIVERPTRYDFAAPSDSDPNQGFGSGWDQN